jgi:hypothetical protein
MNALSSRIALALAVALIGVSPLVSGADEVPAGSGDPAQASKPVTMASSDALAPESPRADVAEPAAGERRAEEGHKRSNSPHPAVLSYERPVLPIGVPNPPVSLERY